MKMNENQDDVIELFTDSEMVSVCSLIDELRLKMGILQEYLLKRETRTNETNLSAMYRFENFLPYDGNMLAYSSAKAASAGDMICNPICIYGTSGNGKTHLLQAIGNEIIAREPDKKVFYNTAEFFVDVSLSTMRRGWDKVKCLRQRYKSVDVLLLDDIQIFNGKEASSQELANIVDSLYRAGKLVVMTSNKNPKELTELNEHVINLVNSGLVVEIVAPDQSVKRSIVRKKAHEAGIKLSDEVIDYIASLCNLNISEIEGAIKCMKAYSRMVIDEVSLDKAKAILEYFL